MPRIIIDDGHTWLPIRLWKSTIVICIWRKRGKWAYVDLLHNAIDHEYRSWKELLQNWGWIK